MTAPLAAALQGFSLGAGLIVAIGAQNAFVLRQGLLRRHVPALVLFCALADAALIALGAAGFGTLVAGSPRLLTVVGLGGAAFLLAYGLHAFRAALAPPRALDAAGAPEAGSLGATLATAAALTFFNPHVYLDTVVLVGGIAGRFPVPERAWFATGAAAASLLWFGALGFGARLLAPLFARPAAWRLLDVGVGVVMTLLAALLLRGTLAGRLG